MKVLLAPAILVAAALMLGTTLVLNCAEPSSVVPPLVSTSTDLNFDQLKPASMFLYPQPTRDLPHPGIHQADSQSFKTGPIDRGPVSSQATPIYLDNQPKPAVPLQPGVYQTYPYTIIIVVPDADAYIRYAVVKPDSNFPMPIINPHLEVVPRF